MTFSDEYSWATEDIDVLTHLSDIPCADDASVTVDTCQQCVQAGRSWQEGKCNPTNECTIEDTFCWRGKCDQWERQQQVKMTCTLQRSCGECIDADEYCGWLGSLGQCTMVTDIPISRTIEQDFVTNGGQNSCRPLAQKRNVSQPKSAFRVDSRYDDRTANSKQFRTVTNIIVLIMITLWFF